MSEPLTLLVYEPAWRRIAAAVAALPLQPPVLMDGDGGLTRGGTPVTAADEQVDAAWAAPDIYLDGCANPFLDHALQVPHLRWLQSGAAGMDNPRFAQLSANGTLLTANDAPAVAIAELVLAGVLDHYQRGPERREAQMEAAWQPLPFREIAGSNWVIVGFGAIGREVGRRARAFDAHVTGIRRSGGPETSADRIAPPDRLAELLPEADVVVLALPLVAETEGYADAAFFRRLKPGCVFVNVGRGPLVDERALIEALDDGTIGHAVLDVFRVEPLPSESPLWRHSKASVTAHLAGMGSGLLKRSDALFVDNLTRFLEGRALRNLVSPESFAPAAT